MSEKESRIQKLAKMKHLPFLKLSETRPFVPDELQSPAILEPGVNPFTFPKTYITLLENPPNKVVGCHVVDH